MSEIENVDLTAPVSSGNVEKLLGCPERGDLRLAVPLVDLLFRDQVP